MKEEGSLGAGARLGEHLGRQHSEREPGIHELGRQPLGKGLALSDDRFQSQLFLGVAQTFRKVVEHIAVVQIRDVNQVPAAPQLIGEGQATWCQAQCVMEQEDLGDPSILSALQV